MPPCFFYKICLDRKEHKNKGSCKHYLLELNKEKLTKINHRTKLVRFKNESNILL